MCSPFLFCFQFLCAAPKLYYSKPLIPNPKNAIVNQVLLIFNFQSDSFLFIAFIMLAKILVVLAKITSGPETLAKI